MKDSHEKGVAIHLAPSFALGTVRCTAKHKQGNRWAEYGASKMRNQDADAVKVAEGNMMRGVSASPRAALRSRRPQTCLDTSCTGTLRPRGCLHQVARPTGGPYLIGASTSTALRRAETTG